MSRTFTSLRYRNYRLFFAGQAVSQVGSWMQRFALGWFLLQLTDDATPCSKQSRWFTDGEIQRISIRHYPNDIRWYASVVREGPVAAGDEVRLLPTR